MHLPRWFRILALVAHATAMVALTVNGPFGSVAYPILFLTISGTYLSGLPGGIGLALLGTLLLVDDGRTPTTTLLNGLTRLAVLLVVVAITYLLTWRTKALEQKTRELEREIAARNEFTAVVAHELRNPLNAIRAATAVLPNHPEPAKLAAGIDDEAAAGLSLIEAMTEVASIETGRLRSLLSPIDLADVVRLATEIRDGDARVRVSDLSQPLPVFGDAARLSQVVKNLVGNALKYSPPTEPIEIVAGVSTDRRAAVVSVRDYGPGIPLAERAHLFRKFKRLSTAGATRGSGLGLYICQQIVSDHGGTLEANWPSGGGTRFSFTVPLR